MKFFLTLIFTAFSLFSFSQNKIFSDKNQVGFLNIEKSKFDWSEINYSSINIFFDKESVWMDNEDKSFYKIQKYQGPNSGTTSENISWSDYSWVATDKKGKICYLSITKYEDGDVTFTVLYNNICFRYFCKVPTKLDNF